MSEQTKQLEKNALEVATEFYDVINSMPEEDRAAIELKLRFNTVDFVNAFSAGLASILARDALYSFAQAKRSLSSMKTLYRLASNVGHVELDPELMQEVASLLDVVDEKLEEAQKAVQAEKEEVK